VRVSTAFNRMLRVPGAKVDEVEIGSTEVLVRLRRTSRWHTCPCGERTQARYDRSRRRWRHLDLGSLRLWLEADIARIDCQGCGRVRTETVPWARPGARHSSDLEQLIAWLAQRLDKTSICRLLRVSWEAVHAAVTRVVAEHRHDDRLDNLFKLGVDEISYKRGHQYLTVVADHDSGRVVWVAEGRSQQALQDFFDLLGPERCAQIQAISMDMAVIWRGPCERSIPQADICFDPFHLIRWVNQALDEVYRAAAREHGTGTGDRDWRTARYALRAGAERLTPKHRALLRKLQRSRHDLWRAWELKEEFRALFQTVEPNDADSYLTWWIAQARNSGIGPMVTLARRIQNHFDGIVATVHWGISNSRLEGINSKIRLINRRGHGHPNPKHLAAMIHLCLGGITLDLPTQT
jgi:transposase